MSGRIRFTLLFFFGAFLLVLIRLFYWQVIKADALVKVGQLQYGQAIELSSKRGEIKTSDGFPIATNKLTYLVYANPKQIDGVEKTAKLLAPLLGKDESSISAQLSLDKFWVPLATYIENDTKKEIEKLGIKGVGFEDEYQRFYPEASLSAQLLGFVGKDELVANKGYFGVEGYYDRQLRGKGGRIIQIHDAFGRPILSQMNDAVDTTDGRSLTLHINRAIQYIVEKKLSEGVQLYGAQSGMVGVMDPKTGSIIAMASYPTYDPRNYQEYTDDLYKNPFISNTYEPGSTFKALMMAAALNSDLVKPDTHCPICAGPVPIGEYKIKTWNDEYKPNLTMTEVIERSDNTGMVYIAQKLGLDRILSYFHAFGIGELTGIDVQGETTAPIRPRESWYPIDVATAGFGQGISVTAISLLDAFAAIANDGKRMEPHIVKSIQTPEGDDITIPSKVLDRPISEKTAKIMTEILVNAVDNGEAKWTKLKGYRIAGKTGTAQIPIAGHYDPTKTIASFIGFAPADDPQFVMLVIIDRPTKSIYGAETAAPIFMDIAKDLFAYYRVAPSQ